MSAVTLQLAIATLERYRAAFDARCADAGRARRAAPRSARAVRGAASRRSGRKTGSTRTCAGSKRAPSSPAQRGRRSRHDPSDWIAGAGHAHRARRRPLHARAVVDSAQPPGVTVLTLAQWLRARAARSRRIPGATARDTTAALER